MEQTDARGATITLIHYVFQVDPERIACMPNMSEKEFGSTPYHQHVVRTNSPQAVTCPACKRTEQFKQTGAARGL